MAIGSGMRRGRTSSYLDAMRPMVLLILLSACGTKSRKLCEMSKGFLGTSSGNGGKVYGILQEEDDGRERASEIFLIQNGGNNCDRCSQSAGKSSDAAGAIGALAECALGALGAPARLHQCQWCVYSALSSNLCFNSVFC